MITIFSACHSYLNEIRDVIKQNNKKKKLKNVLDKLSAGLVELSLVECIHLFYILFF